MARDYHHGQKATTPPRRRKTEVPTGKILKAPSKTQREAALRHAVTHGDMDALEDYDEPK